MHISFAMDMPTRLGPEELRAFRERLLLTQREFARRLGIFPNNLAAMESGKRVIGNGVRARIALMEIARRLGESDKPAAQAIARVANWGLARGEGDADDQHRGDEGPAAQGVG